MTKTLNTDIREVLADRMAKEIQKEIDKQIIQSMLDAVERSKEEKAKREKERLRKQALVDKYLAGDATCQEAEEAKDIIVEGI